MISTNTKRISISERPIIFNAEMVRAILDGRKTQTRRVVNLNDSGRVKEVGSARNWHLDDPEAAIACPYGQKGSRLWVRETWADVNTNEGPAICYRADGSAITWHDFSETFGPDYGAGPSMDYDAYPGDYCMWIDDLLNSEPEHRWKSPIYMPRWASRITLEITDVRVERLQDIYSVDCISEGIIWPGNELYPSMNTSSKQIAVFKNLWDSINGKKEGCSWADNPYVWVVEFKRINP